VWVGGGGLCCGSADDTVAVDRVNKATWLTVDEVGLAYGAGALGICKCLFFFLTIWPLWQVKSLCEHN
jgi:hypothetical protein